MPPPIVPAPITPTDLIGTVGVLGRHVRDLRRLALGEEGVALRGGFGAGDQFAEQFGLARETGLEIGRIDRRLHGLDDVPRRLVAAEGAGIFRWKCLKQLRLAARLGELVVAVPHAPERPALGEDSAGECHGLVLQPALLDDRIDEAEVERLRGLHRLAARHDLQRAFDADDARQPLGAAGAGKQPQQHLRQADRGRGHRDAIVAGERGLEPAAERSAVDRRDDRLGARVEQVDHDRERRLLRRLAELGDVGTGEERPAAAGQHDRLHRIVADERAQALDHGRADCPAERVHGRRVDRDDADVALDGVGADTVHGFVPLSGRCARSVRHG